MVEYGTLTKDGVVNKRTVTQTDMTSECWLIQFNGLSYCETCEFKDLPQECGGMNIRKTGKNEKGFKVPLGKG